MLIRAILQICRGTARIFTRRKETGWISWETKHSMIIKYFVVNCKNRLMRKIKDLDMKKIYSKGEKNVFELGFQVEDQV
jgi:Fe-S cluster biosynthesis and repair protein YggX